MNFPQRSTKKKELNELFNSFAKSLKYNQFRYTAELAADTNNIRKYNNVIKKWKQLNEKSCEKTKPIFDQILKQVDQLNKKCVKNRVPAIEFNRFIQKFDGDMDGTLGLLHKTTVIAAADEGDINMLNLLSELGANFNSCSDAGISPLNTAINKGDENW